MSSSALRAVAILEGIGNGERTVSGLARRLGVDKSTVSRVVTALEADGWVHRRDRTLDLGPRAAVLGVNSPEHELAMRARRLAHVVAGVTGTHATVVQLAGTRAFMLAEVAGSEPLFQEPPVIEAAPLWAVAVGACIASQLTRAEIDAALPAEPFPAFTDATITTRAQFDTRVALVRAGEAVVERGEYSAEVGCIALPWPGADPLPPLAMGCLVPVGGVDAALPLVERVLRAAVEPAATREDVIAAAAPRRARRRR